MVMLFSVVLCVLPILLSIAWYTLIERHLLATFHFRVGPDEWAFGIMQPLLDGLKLFIKSLQFGYRVNVIWYMCSAIVMLLTSCCIMLMLSFDCWWRLDVCELSLLLVTAIGTFNCYFVFLFGFNSDCRFSLFGSVRFILIFICIEVCYSLVFVFLLFNFCLFDLTSFWLIGVYFAGCLSCMIVSIVAFYVFLIESGRVPFDLVECESELVSGFITDYGGAIFAMVFLGEYGSMIVSAILLINLFVSCFYLWVTVLLIVILLVVYSVGRIFLPRYRIDQLVFGVWGALCWMVFICFEMCIIDCL